MRTLPPLLDITQVQAHRGATTILRDISWRVQPGENWVIMGANGCGKTTLLKVLAGYLSPSSGDISLLGHRYGESDWRDVREQLGIVSSSLQASIPPGEPALETVISGRYAQLDFWGTATADDDRAARRWLKQFGISHLATRPWLYLSQGERQRVLIARALMAAPRLLVLDEPCAGLDPVARAHFLAQIDAVAARPKAPGLVLVTHHVEEITPIFTHVLLLAGGQVVASGPRHTVLTSTLLSKTFGAAVTLTARRGQLRLNVD